MFCLIGKRKSKRSLEEKEEEGKLLAERRNWLVILTYRRGLGAWGPPAFPGDGNNGKRCNGRNT